MQFHHTVLDNGLEIIAETNPAAQSAALGFFVKTGARDEQPLVSGVSHFLEHMAFKGDEAFTALDVNRVFDELGADYNAATSEELTVYHAAVLPEYLDPVFDLLAVLMRPSLRELDFTTEKKVILEEIGMYEDVPAWHVSELAMLLHFTGHPLGQSVLGSRESIGALSAEQMRAYHVERYGARNLVLAASGRVDWDQFVVGAQRRCASWNAGVPGRARDEARPAPRQAWHSRPAMHQQHVVQLSAAPSSQSELRFAAELAGAIMGDDGSGRLYWELVETGLAESCDLSYNDFDGSGIWSTYICCAPEDTDEVLERVSTLYAEFNRSGPTAEELDQARNKVASRVVLASERPMGRLLSVGGNWIYQGAYRSVEDDLKTLHDLTLEDVRELLRLYPLGQTTTVGLGPLAG